MKCSLGISNFLEEVSNLSHYVVVLYFLAWIAEEGFLISPCYSLELCIQMGMEGVPGLPGAPQEEAGLTRKFEISRGYFM